MVDANRSPAAKKGLDNEETRAAVAVKFTDESVEKNPKVPIKEGVDTTFATTLETKALFPKRLLVETLERKLWEAANQFVDKVEAKILFATMLLVETVEK